MPKPPPVIHTTDPNFPSLSAASERTTRTGLGLPRAKGPLSASPRRTPTAPHPGPVSVADKYKLADSRQERQIDIRLGYT
jgi:hypothetical protein